MLDQEKELMFDALEQIRSLTNDPTIKKIICQTVVALDYDSHSSECNED